MIVFNKVDIILEFITFKLHTHKSHQHQLKQAQHIALSPTVTTCHTISLTYLVEVHFLLSTRLSANGAGNAPRAPTACGVTVERLCIT